MVEKGLLVDGGERLVGRKIKMETSLVIRIEIQILDHSFGGS